MIYPYECDPCDLYFEISKPMDDALNDEACPDCGVRLERVFTAPSILVLGDPLPMKIGGHNISKGRRTDRQQERVYANVMNETRKLARARRGERHGDGSVRMAAQIPRELYMARTQQYGKNYWVDEGKKALKRDGLSFEK